jgi:hypothetical protein
MGNPGHKIELLQQAVDAVAAYGSQSAAARELGINRITLGCRYRAAVSKGFKANNQALAGWAAENSTLVTAPPSNAIPEGQQMRGLSTRVDGEGKTDQQWIKTERASGEVFEAPPDYLLKGISVMTDAKGQERVKWQKLDMDAVKRQTAQEAAFKAMCEKLEPISEIAGPSLSDTDLLTVYTLTDCHIGMLAWDKETGSDWDLTIAERCLVGTLTRMIDAAPSSREGLVNELGDFEHFDSMKPVTPEHGHILDADSRFQKLVMVSTRILRRVIEHALTKHEIVHVQIKEGNHDPSASVWKRVMFSMLYANNPRVHIDMSPNPYTVHEHGKTLLGFYHGHLARLDSLGELFAAQFREQWGRCPYVYIHTGHKHHVKEEERKGCTLVQHPTLAAPDAYAARGGWISKRQATSMTYHRETGEFARGIFIPTL